MKQSLNKQLVLKPQDLVVILKIAVSKDKRFTYAQLSADLAISASEVHASVRRCQMARLMINSPSDGMTPIRTALREFVLHGVKYAFPAVTGSVIRGMPTAYAGPALRSALVQSDESPPVWPYPSGIAKGPTLYPLHPNVPIASERDPKLYEVLTLVDAIRIGAARERELAASMIKGILS